MATEEKRGIKRFNAAPVIPGGLPQIMDGDPAGDYVRFEDYQAALAEKDADLEARVGVLRDQLDEAYGQAPILEDLASLLQSDGSDEVRHNVVGDIQRIAETLGRLPERAFRAHDEIMAIHERAEKAESALQDRDAQWRRVASELVRLADAAEEEERRRVSHGMNGAGPHSAARAYRKAGELLDAALAEAARITQPGLFADSPTAATTSPPDRGGDRG